jgi:hypothetical protein
MTRRRFLFFIQSEDYPAIIPEERSEKLLGRELAADENGIRGALVVGLTAEDIKYLDVFECDVRIPRREYRACLLTI